MKRKILIIPFLFIILVFSCTPKKTDSGFGKINIPSQVSESDIVLKISGLISGPVLLDMKTVMSFPKTNFTSTEPWDENEHEFAGVELYPLLERIGLNASAEKIEVIAHNDYKAYMSIEDIQKYKYILAYEIDGQITHKNPDIKSRGSVFIAINFNKFPALDTEVYKYHLVWHVKEIIIE